MKSHPSVMTTAARSADESVEELRHTERPERRLWLSSRLLSLAQAHGRGAFPGTPPAAKLADMPTAHFEWSTDVYQTSVAPLTLRALASSTINLWGVVPVVHAAGHLGPMGPPVLSQLCDHIDVLSVGTRRLSTISASTGEVFAKSTAPANPLAGGRGISTPSALATPSTMWPPTSALRLVALPDGMFRWTKMYGFAKRSLNISVGGTSV